MFVIPYGPIRSGVFEAIQFLIETGGEDVLALADAPVLQAPRARAALPRARRSSTAVYVAERVAGIASRRARDRLLRRRSSVRSASSRPRARSCWRAVHAELERIANHLDVIAKEAETTALVVGQARFAILKENVLRLQAAL